MKSVRELQELYEKVKIKFQNRKRHILICGGTGCASSQSQKLIDEFENEFRKNNINDIEIVKT